MFWCGNPACLVVHIDSSAVFDELTTLMLFLLIVGR